MNEPEERFYYLAEKSLDEQLDAKESQELESLLKSDAEFKELFFQLRHQHSQLTLDPRVSGPSVPNLFSEDITPPTKSSKPTFNVWKLVALITCAISLWSFIMPSSPSPTKAFATLEQTDACVWEGGSLPTLAGSSLSEGFLKLKQGHARLKFNSGAILKIEGPAEIEIIDDMNCILHHGSLVAEVPPSAHLFKVDTPKAEIIDLGTSFSVSVDSQGDSWVHVLEGEVKAKAKHGKDFQNLTTGQGGEILDLQNMHFVENMTQEWSRINHKEQNPIKPMTLKVRTDDGMGDDSYVFSQVHANISDTILLVKNGGGGKTNFMRQVYLKFDLSELPEEELLKATLQLQFVQTGFGMGVNLPDSEFIVYTFPQDQHDQWNYSELTWKNAPAFTEGEPGSTDFSQALELGRFTVPRGRENELYELSSDALKKAILNDPNKTITLFIARVTKGNYSPSDTLVHGIASRRHPSAQAPTLKLDYKPPQQI